MHADPNEIGLYIKATRDVLDILKTLGGLLPKGADSEAAKSRLLEAEKALRVSEVQLAKALGYKLCQCTFPPEIMLVTSRNNVLDIDIRTCAKCGRQEPSQTRISQELQSKAEAERYDQSRRYF
jgi:hypothetical protein